MHVKIQFPPHVWNIREIQAIVGAGDIVGEKLEDAVQETDDNITVLTSRESGIARREEILGIIPKVTDTLEDRKLRVHLRWYNRESYTERSMKEKLNGAIGKNNYTMEVWMEEKLVKVVLELSRKSMFQSVQQLLDDVVPLDYLIDVVLRYNSYKRLENLTYGQMSGMTFKQLREDVI